jgi:hypothetical protein
MLRPLSLALLLLPTLLLAAEPDDEITTIRSLWAAAQAGKTSKLKEADVVALMTPSWRGRRLSPWCYHALIKMGVPADKHYELFTKTAAHKEPRKVDGKDVPAKDWLASAAGPALPDDLQKPFLTAWTTALDIIVTKFEAATPRAADNFSRLLAKMLPPKELLIPRFAKIMSDTKKPIDHRNIAVWTLAYQGAYEGSIDPLIPLLNDPSPRIRGSAISALREQLFPITIADRKKNPSPPYAEKLFKVFYDTAKSNPDPNVVADALGSMEFFDLKPFVPQVLELYKLQKKRGERLIYMLALQKIPEGIPVAVEFINNPDELYQRDAITALDYYLETAKPDPVFAPAIPILENLAKTLQNADTKRRAEKALNAIKRMKL